MIFSVLWQAEKRRNKNKTGGVHMVKKQAKKKTVEKGEETKEEESSAEHIFEAVGSIVPSLGKFMKNLGKTDVLKGRLKEVDEELKKRLKEAGKSGAKPLPRSVIGYSIGTIRGEGSVLQGRSAPAQRSKPEPQEKMKKIVPGKARTKGMVDVFEKEDIIHVITELKGVKASDIKVTIDGQTAYISAKGKKKAVKLPCAVKGIVTEQYKNNILEVVLKKK